MINNHICMPDHAAIYPGEYEPLPRSKETLMDALGKADTCIIKAPVNISKLHDQYRIEIALPGLKREDLFVDTDGRVLTVAGMYRKPVNKEDDDEYCGPLRFNRECMRQEIDLPPDADADFLSAEYHDGILTIWIFKTKCPDGKRARDIVVY